MKIAILSSSRADYGIYIPLLEKMKKDSFFEIEIIAFGTHLSKTHGFTLKDIEKDGYPIIHSISSLIANDDEQSIATSYGLTVIKFADFWENHKYDMVFCLGDRFEMSAAIQAGIPFQVFFVHLYGGETTLGAIDNIYRHQITLASKIHFTATESYKQKVEKVLGNNNDIYSVGSLSLDEIKNFISIEKNEFYNKYKIYEDDFALITFHPETIAINKNTYFATEMSKALQELAKDIFLVITMPNADTQGTIFRNSLEQLKLKNPNKVSLIENFGKENYFTAMYYSKLLIGNTSSGIVEAASFGKYVVNVGDRQKGRTQSQNILDALFESNDIIKQVKNANQLGKYNGENIYYKESVADTIIKTIKSYEKL